MSEAEKDSLLDDLLRLLGARQGRAEQAKRREVLIGEDAASEVEGVGRRVFTVVWVRVFLALAFGAMAVCSLPPLIEPGKGGLGLRVVVAAMAVAEVAITVRSARCATVVATESGVRHRGFLRTRRWSWEEIDRFEAVDRFQGAYLKRVMCLHETSGAVRRFEDFNVRASRGPNQVDRAVAALNDLLMRHRGQVKTLAQLPFDHDRPSSTAARGGLN